MSHTGRLSDGMMGILKSISLLILPLVVPVVLAANASLVFQREVITMLMYVVVVVGFYIFAGNSGVLSFGHVSFMAIGAYSVALMTIPIVQKAFLLPDLPKAIQSLDVPTFPASIIAGLVGMCFAATIGISLMRLQPLSIALSMFAVLLIVHVVLSHWDSVTRGQASMLGVPQTTSMGSALAFAAASIVIALAFEHTRVGLRLRASREDEIAASAVGIRIVPERYLAFILSAFVVGVGGALFAQFLGSFNPDTFYLQATFLTIAMLIIGGMNSLTGAVYGVVVVSVLSSVLLRIEQGVELGALRIPRLPGLANVALAILMLVILNVRPSGLFGARDQIRKGRGARRSSRVERMRERPGGTKRVERTSSK